MNGEFINSNNLDYNQEYNQDYNQGYNKNVSIYTGNGMCMLLLIIVVSVFLSYCCRCSNTQEYNMNDNMNDNETSLLSLNSIDYNICVDSNQKKCSICLEDYQQNDKISILKCDHIFHNECIKKWLNNNGTCPFCREYLL